MRRDPAIVGELTSPTSTPGRAAVGDGAPRAGRRRRRTDERGSTLILALVFLVACSLIVTALVGWIGNDLRNTASFRTGRSIEYAAGGAVQIEVQTLRYLYTAGSATTSTYTACTPGSGASIAIDGQSIAVYCNISLSPNSAITRVVTLDACPASESSTLCTAGPFLKAVVTFDDFSNIDTYHCTSVSDEATCGTGMAMTSWIID